MIASLTSAIIIPVLLFAAAGLLIGYGLTHMANRLQRDANPVIEKINALLPQTQLSLIHI